MQWEFHVTVSHRDLGPCVGLGIPDLDIHELDLAANFEFKRTVFLQPSFSSQLVLHIESERRAFQPTSVLIAYGKKKGTSLVRHSSAAQVNRILLIGTVNARSVTSFAGCRAVQSAIPCVPWVRVGDSRGIRLCLVPDFDLYASRGGVRNP